VEEPDRNTKVDTASSNSRSDRLVRAADASNDVFGFGELTYVFFCDGTRVHLGYRLAAGV
jgi:hypothetical protein